MQNQDITAIISVIRSKDNPIILMDTCSIIDIIRVGLRDNIQINHLVGALEVLKKLENDEITVILVEVVAEEIQDHKEHTVAELSTEQKKLKEQVIKLLEVSKTLNIPCDVSYNNANLKISIEDTLSKVIDRLIEQSIIMQEDDECTLDATRRSRANKTPSQKGKGSIKDCLIIEHYLKLVKNLRSINFDKAVIFITSNFKDFGVAPEPKFPLNDEFNSLQIQYCNNFQWALKIIQEDIDPSFRTTFFI